MRWKRYFLLLLVFCAVLFLASHLLSGKGGNSTNALLTEIGRYETRGHPNPSLAEGPMERVGNLYQRAVGRYQIQLATARWLGYAGSRNALFYDSVGAYWAQQYLDRIKHRLEHRCGRRGATLRAIAYGYPHGHNALLCDPPVSEYVDTIVLNMQARRMQAVKNWENNRKIMLVRL